jgi:hypothetical protein
MILIPGGLRARTGALPQHEHMDRTAPVAMRDTHACLRTAHDAVEIPWRIQQRCCMNNLVEAEPAEKGKANFWPMKFLPLKSRNASSAS